MAEIVIAIANGRTQGEYLIDLYQVQIKHRKLYLEDIALAYLEDNGEVKLIQTAELTTSKGATRGAGIGLLAGFVIGGPIGAAVVGGGIGALIGRHQDKGITNELMESLQSRLTNGQALVFAKAEGYNARLAADFAKDKGEADQVYTTTISEETESEIIALYREANPDA
jgi:uncharacterized membrane protein